MAASLPNLSVLDLTATDIEELCMSFLLDVIALTCMQLPPSSLQDPRHAASVFSRPRQFAKLKTVVFSLVGGFWRNEIDTGPFSLITNLDIVLRNVVLRRTLEDGSFTRVEFSSCYFREEAEGEGEGESDDDYNEDDLFLGYDLGDIVVRS